MRLPTGCIAGQIYQFTLKAAEEILRHRIVVRLALPGYTLHKAQFFELFPVCRCRILHAPIRMKHQPRCRALPFYSHAKCRQGQRRIDAVGKCIAHQLEQKADRLVTQEYGDYSIQKKTLEAQRQDALAHLSETGQTAAEVNEQFDTLVQEATDAFKERVGNVLEETVPTLCEEVVKTVETKKRERTKETIEEAVRDHLRGFARTIPSFLMAYGDDETTLSTFDMIIPDDVFYEVTSITLDQFRFLRDGSSYTDAETGEEKRYPGKLFDPVVFDDSIKEFLSLRTRLGNYFDETHTEDIFDYIPPQKTNQIFTPKRIVKQMVDMLEQENPGCFDDPGKTFADLYMKSGLYIAEIVKRLFNSDGMKQAFPDETQRLQHIFEHQVYGLAPTEIIYQIALHFILGFEGGELIDKHHLRQCDALPLAKDGTLEAKLDSIFG